MPDKGYIEPDMEFIREINAQAGDMEKCFQCSTCSVVCPITPDVNPFPRKEMIWAQWGLKDRLLKDPDIWLCHNCNDCSDQCPRGGSPGDLLATLRNYYYRRNAFPAFLGEWLSNATYLPFLAVIPAVLLLAMVGISGAMGWTEGFALWNVSPVQYRNVFYGLTVIDPIFVGALAFVVVSFYISISRFWKDLNESSIKVEGKGMPIGAAIVATIKEILAHEKFDECGPAKERTPAHKALIWSFIMLAIVTGIIMIFEWLEIAHEVIGIHSIPVIHSMLTPLALWNPVKILANVGAVLLIYGIFKAISNRMNDPEDKNFGKTTYYDLYLLYVIATVAITGIGAEVFRLFTNVANIAPLAYIVYFIHLISVFMLIAYLPFSKFAHIVYRTTAIIHAKHTGRYELTADDLKTSKSA
jgi:quinone-modifying oxidoreductase subunit QmoC